MRLKSLQQTIQRAWGSNTYTAAFEAGPPHRHLGHAVHHAMVALGRVAKVVDELDHGVMSTFAPERRFVADLVILALRIAALYPGGMDLEAEVRARVLEKFGVSLSVEDGK